MTPPKPRILTLFLDAYGGWGGMAVYASDVLTSLCAHPSCPEVTALVKNIHGQLDPIPESLHYPIRKTRSKWKYIIQALRIGYKKRFDLIVCGHMLLLPLALLLRGRSKKPIILFLYGIEAWTPPALLIRRCIKHADYFVAISDYTRQRFSAWSGMDVALIDILPNAIHTIRFTPGHKPSHLIERYGLQDRTVLLTLGRLHAEERYKGLDETLEVLPDLLKVNPKIAYLIVGDGTDRPRLEKKARDLGLSEHVIFAGRISESEKAEHYRLADAFVMPGRGEGFGFVYLEALACGTPVVASAADGSREAVRNGRLGELADPNKPDDIQNAIKRALLRPKNIVPEGLDYFSFENFQKRLWILLDRWLTPPFSA